MIDRSEIHDMVERITHGVSCRLRRRSLFIGILGGALVLALVAVVLLLRRRGEELSDEEGEEWDGESLPDTFPDTLRGNRADDLGEGDDAAVPGSRARRQRRRSAEANNGLGGLASGEGDLEPA